MTNFMSNHIFGIDVAKDELVVCTWQTEAIVTLPNERQAVHAWLRTLPGQAHIALEPTSDYHLVLVEAAHAYGHCVYLVNPRQLRHYREAINVRNKTDPLDAWLLARYLAHEGHTLQPYQPQCPQAQQLWALLKRRATVVASRQQLQQSFAATALSIRALLTEIQRVLARIDRQILKLIRVLGWTRHYRYCLSIPGIGPLNAAALVAAYQRGAFASEDAFVAYIGMDIRVRESGRFKGKRKLTKRGEAELRRLLYCAAQGARCEPRFDAYYQRQLDKGLSKTAAKVILARKLARIAFALMSQQQMFIKQEVPA